jgi:hypothetical protein
MSPIQSVPTVHEQARELSPLVGSVAIYGPPVLFLAVPWLLVVIVLITPLVLALALIGASLGLTATLTGVVCWLRSCARPVMSDARTIVVTDRIRLGEPA